MQVDGAGDDYEFEGRDRQRFEPDGHVVQPPDLRPALDQQQAVGTSTSDPRLGLPPAAEVPTSYLPPPPAAGYLHQSLLDRITERLRDEAGLSPEAIAELLKKGAHLLPPPPVEGTALAPPDLPFPTPATAEPQTQVPPVPATKADTVSTAHLRASTKAHKSKSNRTPTTMSPGILIPRNAGIKLRGVSPEPPLVDAPAPDKSKIVVASQYLFQHDLERAGMMDERDVQGRLQGIAVIEAGRRGLRM